MEAKRGFSTEEARRIADDLGLDFAREPFDLEQFRMGSTSSWNMVDVNRRRT